MSVYANNLQFSKPLDLKKQASKFLSFGDQGALPPEIPIKSQLSGTRWGRGVSPDPERKPFQDSQTLSDSEWLIGELGFLMQTSSSTRISSSTPALTPNHSRLRARQLGKASEPPEIIRTSAWKACCLPSLPFSEDKINVLVHIFLFSSSLQGVVLSGTLCHLFLGYTYKNLPRCYICALIFPNTCLK